jgi:hypothetical protein
MSFDKIFIVGAAHNDDDDELLWCWDEYYFMGIWFQVVVKIDIESTTQMLSIDTLVDYRGWISMKFSGSENTVFYSIEKHMSTLKIFISVGIDCVVTQSLPTICIHTELFIF